MCINLTYTFFAGFGGDKHNHFNVVTFGNDAIAFLVIMEGKVRNNNTVDSALHAFATEIFESELHNRV